MPPRKTKPSRKTAPAPAPAKGFPWKKTLLVGVGVLIVAGYLLSTGVVQDLTAGPKTPLPRTTLGLDFGADLKTVLARFPGSKDRPFNNDPHFRILTLKDRKDMPEGAAEAELIFFEDRLYFVSAKWEENATEKVPVDAWSEEYRRWKRRQPNDAVALQGAGQDTVLNEWYFDDGTTEMILRDLKFNQTVNRWKDLRDASNQAAQRAFAPYRFDLQ